MNFSWSRAIGENENRSSMTPVPRPHSAPLPHPSSELRSSQDARRSAPESKDAALGSARSPQENSFWSLQKLQDCLPVLQSQYKAYEDAFVKKVKDELMIVRDHPVEACGVAVAAGLLVMRGPRRFLLRNTLGRLQSEEARLTEAELSLKELGESVEKLKKESKNMLLRAGFGEETLQRGQTKIRDAGHEIRRVAKSIYKIESNAEDLMDGLRVIPGRNSLKLRAEVASMSAELKQQRHELDKRITKISEYGIRI